MPIHNNGICISNLVYGYPYTDIFLSYHLKSLLNPIHLDAFSGKLNYLIITDSKSKNQITSHPNFLALQKNSKHVKIYVINDFINSEQRYTLQSLQLKLMTELSLENEQLMHMGCADLYYGDNFFANAFNKFKDGAEFVVTNPIRTAYETFVNNLEGDNFSPLYLLNKGLSNLHPLWLFSCWGSPTFTQIPYNMLFNNGEAIVFRGFSVSPQIYIPRPWMIGLSGCVDISFAGRMENVYFFENWSEMAAVEMQRLSSFYPMYSLFPSDTKIVGDWASKNIPRENIKNLFHPQIIASRNVSASEHMLKYSEKIVNEIANYISNTL